MPRRYAFGFIQQCVTIVEPAITGWTQPRETRIIMESGTRWVTTPITEGFFEATDQVVDQLRECVSHQGERIRIPEAVYQRLCARLNITPVPVGTAPTEATDPCSVAPGQAMPDGQAPAQGAAIPASPERIALALRSVEFLSNEALEQGVVRRAFVLLDHLSPLHDDSGIADAYAEELEVLDAVLSLAQLQIRSDERIEQREEYA